jgi:hypothetical protein
MRSRYKTSNFKISTPTPTPNYFTNMDPPVIPLISARKPGEEIKTKHKEAIRQLFKFAKISL